MTDYYSGSGSLKGARADLGYLVNRWFDQYGLGEKSQYVALRATGQLQVGKAGRVTLPKKAWSNMTGMSSRRYRRGVGMPTPQADPAQVETINVDPVPHGMEVVWDEKDQLVKEILANGGLQAVEELMGTASLNYMAEALDLSFLTPLAAASTPFDATDRAAAVDWSTFATSTPRADVTAAKTNYGGLGLNSVILEYSYNEELRSASDLVTFYGGNIGAGVLNDELLLQFWKSFGIENVFVADDGSPLTNKVILYAMDPSKNPLLGFCGLVRAFLNQEGADAMGVVIRTRDVDYEQHGIYASHDAGFAIVPSGGVRITGC